ncbi:attacin-B-like [Aedes aegypti]|uniref:Attacin C-terminal domain-containing protein n=1 Tax=Aedes aegypti TaxID=7159 RepID=A0A903VTQ4_AEDAE|nr:attacin-B-like [Aedes aegypti]
MEASLGLGEEEIAPEFSVPTHFPVPTTPLAPESVNEHVKQFGTGLHFNEHSFSATRTNQPGAGSQTRLDGSANLFKTPSNRLDLNAFKSRTQPVGSPSFGSHGAGLNWNNANGHGASAGFDRTPAIKETNLYARGRANLWQSKNRQTSLDAFGSASRTVFGSKKRQHKL